MKHGSGCLIKWINIWDDPILGSQAILEVDNIRI